MKQTAFLWCFLKEDEFRWVKTVDGEDDSSDIIDSYLGYGWRHTAHWNWRSRIDFLISVFSLSRPHLLSKTIWSKCVRHNFYSVTSFNEIFIFNSKYHWCNDTYMTYCLHCCGSDCAGLHTMRRGSVLFNVRKPCLAFFLKNCCTEQQKHLVPSHCSSVVFS